MMTKSVTKNPFKSNSITEEDAKVMVSSGHLIYILKIQDQT